MDRVLPASVDAIIAKAIEAVYAFAPLAEKTVVLGKAESWLEELFFMLIGLDNWLLGWNLSFSRL